MRILIYLSVLGRMTNEFSVNSDDVEEVCVGLRLFCFRAMRIWSRRVCFFVVVCTGTKFSS